MGQYDPLEVANYFLEQAWREGIYDFNNLKLQKMVFLAHGWHLAYFDSPLINEPVQAWRHGPVINSLYHNFKSKGFPYINQLGTKLQRKDPNNINNFEYVNVSPKLPDAGDAEFCQSKNLIDAVFNQYKNYTGYQLSDLTHLNESPWHSVTEHIVGEIPHGIIIPDEIIKHYYKNLIKEGA
ncbi:SocA family protein [Planctomycetota bacterium]|nr:SocA family protein [Planctomycetota bacterium]